MIKRYEVCDLNGNDIPYLLVEIQQGPVMKVADQAGGGVVKDKAKYPKIIGVAVKQGDVVVCLPAPNRHHDCMRHAVEVLGLLPPIGAPAAAQGFYDANGRFLDREQALVVAKRSRMPMRNPKAVHALFSEDLW